MPLSPYAVITCRINDESKPQIETDTTHQSQKNPDYYVSQGMLLQLLLINELRERLLLIVPWHR